MFNSYQHDTSFESVKELFLKRVRIIYMVDIKHMERNGRE